MNEKKINLLKRLNRLLNIAVGSFSGVFIGHAVYVYWDYQKHPELYALQSAPWYTSILVYGLGTAVVSIVFIILKWILKKKLKNN